MAEMLRQLAEWKSAGTDRWFTVTCSWTPTNISVLVGNYNKQAFKSWLMFPNEENNLLELNSMLKAIE